MNDKKYLVEPPKRAQLSIADSTQINDIRALVAQVKNIDCAVRRWVFSTIGRTIAQCAFHVRMFVGAVGVFYSVVLVLL